MFQSCKPQTQKQDYQANKVETNIEVNNKIETNNVIKNNELKNIKYQNMTVKYQENFNFPKEELDKLPQNIKEQFVSLLNAPIFYSLKNDGKKSIYQLITINTKVTTTKNDNDKDKENKITVKIPEQNVYKDFNEELIVIQRDISEKKYLISEKMNSFNWKITKENNKIDKFNCKKATALINGEQIIAWYTEDIPINDGPSEYWGLPGLILRIEAPDRIYSAIEIKANENITINNLSVGKPISKVEYNKLLINMKENPNTTNEIKE
jgi:GLPGLI family protein